MITITKHKNTITITGHAGYAPPGQDIVCAGISSLFLCLIYSACELTADRITFDAEPGDSWFKYKSLSEGLDLLIRSFFIGVKNISDVYPECVEVFEYNE